MAEPHAGRVRILNVNDDEAARYVLGRTLRQAGFEVLEAADGVTALDRVHRERPELVLLDINLPDLSGHEVCRRLKADPATRAIPVLQTSASLVSSGDRVHGLEGGADGYLVQPIQPEELVATVRSLLRARAAEEQARALSIEWQATFDSIRDAVCLIDPRGEIVRWNGALAALAGGTGLLRTPFRELLTRLGTQGAAVVDTLGDAACSGRFELAIGDRWFRATADPLVDAEHRLHGGVRVLSDVTERHLMEEELRKRADALAAADRRKDEFLAMLAHELRNPLAAISAGVQMLERRKSGDEQDARMRALALRQTKHLARLVDDLLDVSRITRGKIELRRERVELALIVQAAIQATRPAVEGRGHTLTVHLDEAQAPIFVLADTTRLEQVLINLLDNAAKYTPPSGQLGLSVTHDDRFATLVVSDNGMGIAPDMQGRIFDLFAQVEATLDRSRGGLGIGLTLVRSLVEMHGGSVSVHSDGVGKGSEFTVRIPLAEALPGERGAGENALPTVRLRRVLLVEDNPDAREALRDLLVDWGLTVELAGDGEEAVRRIVELQPELALVDIGLPGIDGYEVARRVRADPRGRGIALVALTGYGDGPSRQRAVEAGFDLHMTKPIDPDALEKVLAGLPASRLHA